MSMNSAETKFINSSLKRHLFVNILKMMFNKRLYICIQRISTLICVFRANNVLPQVLPRWLFNTSIKEFKKYLWITFFKHVDTFGQHIWMPGEQYQSWTLQKPKVLSIVLKYSYGVAEMVFQRALFLWYYARRRINKLDVMVIRGLL